jgi:uncharacterized protein YlzI (FlbEa/FlbD family)
MITLEAAARRTDRLPRRITREKAPMITVHRLGHAEEPFQLNPDLIVTIESTPDTVVTLATTAKVVVSESPEEVAAAMRDWRVGVLSEALRNRRPDPEPRSRHRSGAAPLFAVEDDPFAG